MSLVSILGLGASFALMNLDELKANASDVEYTFKFNSETNKPFFANDESNTKIHAYTKNGNERIFEIVNGASLDNGFLKLNKEGMFFNPNLNEEKIEKNKVSGLKSLKIDFFNAPKLVVKYGWSNNYTHEAEFLTSFNYDFDGNLPSYFAVFNPNNEQSYINEITLTYTCKENLENDLVFDKYYPQNNPKAPYILDVPTLEGRISYNLDRTIGTIFAPGVSKNAGWYDVNKNFKNDYALCWGAANSNLISWYLDQLEKIGYDVSNETRDVNLIFDKFRNNWDPLSGFDQAQGLAWYFTGRTMNGTLPPNLTNQNSGGYLSHLPYVEDGWYTVDPSTSLEIFGNYQKRHPFINDKLTLGNTFELFSESILSQLHYGPASLTIAKKGNSSAASHANTLWGADFDTKTGNVTKLYITDSDDEAYYPGKYLNEVKVIPFYGDEYKANELVDYYLPGGDPSPFKHINATTTLFHPSVVRHKV